MIFNKIELDWMCADGLYGRKNLLLRWTLLFFNINTYICKAPLKQSFQYHPFVL